MIYNPICPLWAMEVFGEGAATLERITGLGGSVVLAL